jgi:hypothetical protein
MMIIPVPMPDGVFVHADALHKCNHFVYRDGKWYAYASKYKSQWCGPKIAPQWKAAVYAGGPTISAIQQGMAVLRERERRRKIKKACRQKRNHDVKP